MTARNRILLLCLMALGIAAFEGLTIHCTEAVFNTITPGGVLELNEAHMRSLNVPRWNIAEAWLLVPRIINSVILLTTLLAIFFASSRFRSGWVFTRLVPIITCVAEAAALFLVVASRTLLANMNVIPEYFRQVLQIFTQLGISILVCSFLGALTGFLVRKCRLIVPVSIVLAASAVAVALYFLLKDSLLVVWSLGLIQAFSVTVPAFNFLAFSKKA